MNKPNFIDYTILSNTTPIQAKNSEELMKKFKKEIEKHNNIFIFDSLNMQEYSKQIKKERRNSTIKQIVGGILMFLTFAVFIFFMYIIQP